MITLNRKVRFSHADFTYAGTNYTEFLFGSIGLKVKAEIRIEVKWSTEDVTFVFLASDRTITRTDSGSFITDGFHVGDTITISDTSLNNKSTFIAALTDDVMTTVGSLTDETVTGTVTGRTAISSIDFYPNLIDNNTAFNLFNLTDRETIPRYYCDDITTDAANPSIMQIATNSRGWVTPSDSATIYLESFNNNIQIFVINHTFNITPIFLANQLKNLQDGIPPAAGQFKDRNCLKYVYTIDAKFTSYDPDVPHTTDGNVDFPKGQTGWFNEFINGRPTVWTKESITYADNATGLGMSNIDYCKITDVTARVVCQTAAGYYYIVQVLYLPLNEDEYINTSTDFKTNFIYERAIVSLSGGISNGENTGDYHFLKNVVGSALSANRTQITFQIDFSQALIDLFDTKDADNLNYLIFITAQNGTFP